MLRRGTLPSLCALLLWIGGCPKRQGPSRIVYVPAPAPRAVPTAPVTHPQVLVIEEPAPPPEPEEAPPPQAPEEPKPQRRRRRPVRADTPTAPTESTAPETPEPPPEAVPALEPRESTAQEAALRQQVQRLEGDIRQRLARLNEARLSPSERKTLEDARTFLAQSTRALESGDLQRALNLARKASLLVAALE
jgi:outer membrane biosynthesis protein TonB